MNTENWMPPQNGECVAEQSRSETLAGFILGLFLGLIIIGTFISLGDKILHFLNHSFLGKAIDVLFIIIGTLLGIYSFYRIISISNLIYLNSSILDSKEEKELDSQERFYLIKGQLKLSGRKPKYLIPKRFKKNPEKLVAFLNDVQENRKSKEKEMVLKRIDNLRTEIDDSE